MEGFSCSPSSSMQANPDISFLGENFDISMFTHRICGQGSSSEPLHSVFNVLSSYNCSFCSHWVAGSFCHIASELSYNIYKKLLSLTSYKRANNNG